MNSRFADSLTIYDGYSNESSVVGKYCGGLDYIAKEITSSKNELFLHFKTDDRDTRKGFEIEYSSSKLFSFLYCGINQRF